LLLQLVFFPCVITFAKVLRYILNYNLNIKCIFENYKNYNKNIDGQSLIYYNRDKLVYIN